MSWSCYLRRGTPERPAPIPLEEWLSACRLFPELEVNPATGAADHARSKAVFFFSEGGIDAQPAGEPEAAIGMMARLALVLGARFEHD